MKSATRRLVAFLTSLTLVAQPFAASAAGYQYQVPMDAPNMTAVSTGSLTASPVGHNFGTLVLGSTAATATTITNAGQDSVHISSINVGAPFAQSNDCPAVLVGGQSCLVSVVFNPSSAGSYNSTLQVTAQEGGASASFSVSGNAVVPTTSLTVAPNSVNFGASNVGTAAAAKSLTITNDGNSPATVSGIGVTDGASDFSQSNNCSATLASGASCTVNLGFTATAYGARTGNLSIYEEASGTLYSVALQGSGNAAVMTVSSSSLTLPDAIVGFPTTATVAVTNAGNLPLLAVSTNVTGTGAEFAVTDSQCGASLAAGASCQVTVTFSPAGAGSKSATLVVGSSNAGTKSVSLTGKGVAQAPALSAVAASLTFTALEVGTTSPTQTVTLTNSGNIPVTVSGLGVVIGASDYAQTNNCATVPVNGSCTINVQFTPALRGARAGTVYLRYDALDLTIPMTGQGLQGVPTLSTGSVDFGGVQVGQAATAQTVTLNNTGDAPLVVQSATVPASDFGASSGCTTVAAGASCQLTVSFTPSALGVRSQSVTIATDAGSKTVALQGTGIKGNASVSASNLNFGTQQVATTSTVQTVTVTNTGSSPLVISGVGLVSGASDYAQANNCATVAVNASCTISVSFTPSTAGTRSGVLAMTHNGDGVTTVDLSGTGQAASATLAVPGIPATHVGASADATAVLTNTGIGILNMTVPRAASVSGTDFSFASTTCASSLAPGASCSIIVRFSPTAAAARTGTLSVDTGAGPQSQPLSATGVQGTASVSPASLSFAPQQVASTAPTQTVTVTNTGTSPLVFSGVGVVSGASDFTQANDCATIAVNASCSINVNFTPSASGARSGVIAMTTDGAGPTTISVSGIGQAASATLSTPSFASTPVGSSTTATAILSNTGIGSLSVAALGAGSVTGTDFSFASTTCSASVPVSGNCSITVKFSPSSTTARSGALSVDTGAGTQTVVLGSTGIQGFASVSPSSLSFAAQQSGTTSVVQAVTVTNTGTDVLTFTGVGIASGAADFAQSNNCGAVAVNGTCTVNVNFTPSAAGARTGTLSFTHNGGGIANVSLTGTGQTPSATLSDVVFGNLPVASSSTLTATLQNTGIAAISVTAPTAASVTGTDFSFVSTTCSATLAAGASCTVAVKFAPSASAARTGALSFATGAGTQTAALSGIGVQGNATVSASSLSFTAQQVATASAAQTVTLTNNGTDALAVSSVTVSAGASDFSQTNNCTSVAAGGTCTISVTFTPSAAGARTGTVSIAHNGTGATSIGLSGTGQAQSASLTTPSFASTPVGSTSTATATLSNTGIGTLSVTTPSAASVSGASFSFVSTTCPTSLPVSGTCTVTVKFSPTSTTTASGSLAIGTGAGTQTVSLGSTGIQGFASIAPSSLTFAAQQTLTTSAVQTVTVTNTGTDVLTFTGVGISTGASDFAQGNNCGSVPVGGTCAVNVNFTPSAAGTRTGTLSFTHNGGGIANVSLTGTGQAPSASLSAVNFGGVAVSSSSTLTSTLTNTGIDTLTVTAPTAASVVGTDYSFVSTTCAASLTAAATCTVSVKFSPTSNAVRSGTLSFATGAGTVNATLSGTGIQGTAAYSPASLTFAAQQITTTSATQGVTVTNTGTSTLTISSVTVATGATDFAQSNNCGVVSVGGTCTITVSFTPSVSGTRTGTISVASNASNGNGTLTLTGTGQGQSASLSTPSFSTTKVGSSSTATATLSNTGIGALALTVPAAGSVSGTDFSFVSTTCASTLAVGTSCTVTTQFSPTSTAARSGSLSVTTGAGTQAATLSATGVQGFASTSPVSLTFAAQQVASTSAVQSVTVTNTGTSTLNFTGVGMVTGASDFAQSNNCTSVAAGASCTINVSFTPSLSGARTGTVGMTHDGGGAITVSLSGTGQSSSAALTTPSFASTPVGSSSNATATLSNTGIGTLSVTTPSAASVTGTGFSFVSTTCTTSLPASGTCTVTVKFSPTSTTAASGSLAIGTGAGTQSVALNANGIQGNASVNPTSLTFAAQQVASASAAQTVTLTNNGTDTLVVSGVTVSTGASDFSQTNNCTSVAASGTCTISVTFTPSAAGARTGTVALTHNGTGTTSIGLSGTGQAQGASLTTPSFASTPVGSSSNATATLSNTGIGTLAVTTPSAASVSGAPFSFVSTTCTTSLPASGTCTVTVKFSPTSTTAASGSLAIGTGAGTQTVTLGSTGIQGFASMSPSSLTFAAQQTSTTSAVQTVTVTNTGTDTLTFTGVGISTGAANFAQSNNCGSVPVNGTCTVNVNFTPSAAGTLTGTLSFTHNGGGIANVNLTGTGQAPSATLSNVAFSTVAVSSSSTLTSTLTNTGLASISVTVPTAASVTGTDFSFVSTTCTTSLAAAGTCTVSVKFSPTNNVARSGTLSFATGAGTASATLNGNGIQGTASYSATTLTFAAQQVASPSAAQAVTITNVGTSTLTISGVSVSAGATDFGQSNSCGTPLAVNGTCTVNVTFTPSVAGARTGTVTIASDSSNGNGTISLTGTGQSATATLSTPSFSNTQVGSNSTANATLTNTGIGALSITVPTTASVTGTDFSFVSTTCTTTLAAAGTCTVTVKFTPTAAATRTGTLSFSTGAGTMSASLSATGIQGNSSVSPASLTFSAQQVSSTSASQAFTLTNNGTASLTVSTVSTTGDFAQSNTCTSAAVAVNGTCTITVTFTPTAAGTRTGTVVIAHNGSGTTSVNLTGTGQAASATLSTPAFSNTQVGQTTSAVATLTNTGVGTLSVTTPAAASVTGVDFSFLSTTCGTSLGASATCTVTVQFAPTAAAARTGSLAIATGAGTQTVTLSATGVNASLVAVSSSSAGTTLPPQTTSGSYFNFSNNGVGPVTITATPTSTGSATLYTQATAGWCYNGLVMTAGTSCQVYGYFYAGAGSYSGALNIPSSAGTIAQTITGTVTGNLNATSAAYGNVTVGSSADATVTVSNTASVTARNMTYAATAPFSIVGNACAATLGAGASCNLTVRYSPTAQGAVSGNYVTVTGQFDRTVAGTADSANPSAVITSYGATSGTGVQAVLGVSPSSAAFGNVQVGQTATSGSITLSNTGNIAATSVAVNAGSGYSVTSNTCAATLNAGSSCTFALVFAPTLAQAYNNNASVTSSVATQAITVTGTGTNPSLYLSGWNAGGNAAMGVVGYNSDSGRWPIFTNNGNGPVVITAHSSTSAFWAYQNCVGTVLAAGASCVTFNGVSSTGIGDYSGSSTVSYTAQGGSTTFTTGVPNYTASIRTTTANVGSVAFGTVAQNQWNGPQTVTITNNATANPLQNIAISFSGGNSGNFTTSGNTCGTTLAGGASCNIQVYFNPTWSANGFGSTLVVTGGYPRMQPGDSGYIPSNTSVNINIPVSGNGAYSQATLTSTAAQGFGGGWYGQGWSYLSWGYRNDGNVAMTLASPSLVAPLGVASNTCSNIAPGASCAIQLYSAWNNDVAATSQSFTPTGATIAPASANASYTVYSAVPTWGVTSLAFGNVVVGSSSSQNITLYNYGANTAYNWAVNNTIASAATGFSFDLSACSNVANGAGGNAQGGSCNVVVTFTPTAAQAYSGSGLYVAAASRLNNTLSVSGAGVTPSLTLTYSSGTSTTTSPTAATATYIVGNNGQGAASSVSFGTSSGTLSTNVSNCPAGSANCGTVTVTSPTAAGSYPFTVTATPSPSGTAASASSTLTVNSGFSATFNPVNGTNLGESFGQSGASCGTTNDYWSAVAVTVSGSGTASVSSSGAAVTAGHLSIGGLINGQAVSAGTYNMTLKAVKGTSYAGQAYSVTVTIGGSTATYTGSVRASTATCTCPASWQLIETQELGFVSADEVQAGMHVRAPDGESWKLVYNAETVEDEIWRVYVADEAVDVNEGHAVMMSDGTWRSVRDLEAGDLIKGNDGKDVVVKGVMHMGRGNFRSLQVEDFGYQLGHTVGHNVLT